LLINRSAQDFIVVLFHRQGTPLSAHLAVCSKVSFR
jgi:hypothetical protein